MIGRDDIDYKKIIKNKLTLKDLILDYLIEEIKKENNESILQNNDNDANIEQS